jgi:hypothetical protein
VAVGTRLPLTEMSTKNLLGVKGDRPEREAENLHQWSSHLREPLEPRTSSDPRTHEDSSPVEGLTCQKQAQSVVKFEVFTALTMKNGVFWDIKTQFVPNRRHITSLLQSPAG